MEDKEQCNILYGQYKILKQKDTFKDALRTGRENLMATATQVKAGNNQQDEKELQNKLTPCLSFLTVDQLNGLREISTDDFFSEKINNELNKGLLTKRT